MIECKPKPCSVKKSNETTHRVFFDRTNSFPEDPPTDAETDDCTANGKPENRDRFDGSNIPAGKFMMGSAESEAGRDKDEGPYREVTIGKAFLMGKYEVTQAEYQKVMGVNPSGHRDCARCPVETVSWDNVIGDAET